MENTIRGKVVASPKSGPWWVLWICVYLWLICAPKVLQPCIDQLVFGLCRFVWVIDLLLIFFSPDPGAPACPSTPKMLWTKEGAPTPYPYDVYTFKFAIESTKEFGGASSIELKRCNEVLNVERLEGLELVHHLVKFFTLNNFHKSFPIFIEQMMC